MLNMSNKADLASDKLLWSSNITHIFFFCSWCPLGYTLTRHIFEHDFLCRLSPQTSVQLNVVTLVFSVCSPPCPSTVVMDSLAIQGGGLSWDLMIAFALWTADGSLTLFGSMVCGTTAQMEETLSLIQSFHSEASPEFNLFLLANRGSWDLIDSLHSLVPLPQGEGLQALEDVGCLAL